MSTDWQPPAERWYFVFAGAVVLWLAVVLVMVLHPLLLIGLMVSSALWLLAECFYKADQE